MNNEKVTQIKELRKTKNKKKTKKLLRSNKTNINSGLFLHDSTTSHL